MKSDLSQHLQQSIKYAQSHQHESFFDMVKKRVKRGFVGIASKLKRIGSKLGGLESLVGGTGGGGSQGGGGGNGGQVFKVKFDFLRYIFNHVICFLVNVKGKNSNE